MRNRLAIVLAAGKGTRMKSELPKVLFPVNGRPMIHFVLDTLKDADINRIIVVVGYKAELVQHELASRLNIEFALQKEQHGTGHAVQVCRPLLEDYDGSVLILAGDSPLTQSESLITLLEEFERRRPACLLGTLHKEDPTGLGRIVRDEKGGFARIVEEKDATDEERQITEVNMSTYLFENAELLHSLAQIKNENKQGEYYITDCPGILKGEGKDVSALPALKPCEALSINTVDHLAIVEAEMRRMGY